MHTIASPVSTPWQRRECLQLSLQRSSAELRGLGPAKAPFCPGKKRFLSKAGKSEGSIRMRDAHDAHAHTPAWHKSPRLLRL